jgi:DNA polymerase
MNVTLDFETYFDSKYSLTKLTTMEYVAHDNFFVQGVGIKIDDEPCEWYGADEAEEAINSINWSEATLICHNTMFDGYILTQHYNVKPNYYVDTAAMSRACYPGQSARLKDVAVRLFPDDEALRKGDALVETKGVTELDPELEEALAEYCIQDTELTHLLYKEMKASIIKDEFDLIDLTCRMFCEPKMVADLEQLTAYRDSEIANSKRLIEASGHPREVLSSNKQFSELLESMGITVPVKISPTTGKEIPALGKSDKAFTQLQAMYPQHKALWEGRVAVKSRIKETRAQRFIDATNKHGTISAPLRYYAAHTGRFGGTEKINMQNMPRNSPLRLALGAPDDQLMYVADLSNIEARMLAWLAGEDELIEQFRNGDDIYSNFASKIYKRPINKNDDPVERFIGKTAVLGLGYGMGANKFHATLEAGAMGPPVKMQPQEAGSIVRGYRNAFSGVPLLWKKLEDKLTQTLNPTFNEHWRCLKFNNSSIELPNKLALVYKNLTIDKGSLTYETRKQETTWGGKITENVVQALSRIIITDGMLRIARDETLKGNIVLTVHDEIIFLGPNKEPHVTMEKLIAHMCTPPVWAPDLPLHAEGGYDKRYSK